MPPQLDPPVIALLSDMGLSDWYVGTMKGVALSICPAAHLVDLCHDIRKQNVQEAAFVLRNCYRYFPRGAVFLCVVDPSVGSERHGLVARSEDYYFVAPDNGLLAPVSLEATGWEARVIENPEVRLSKPSQTFHGRDIFAPAAAHLARGAAFEHFGPPLDRPVQLRSIERIRLSGNSLTGQVTYIDSYGNLITNLTRDMLPEGVDPRRFRLKLKERTMQGISPHYAAVPVNHPLMYWGSSGLLEIGINYGSAAHKWSVQIGECFELEWTTV
jgi:hypothetical protein